MGSQFLLLIVDNIDPDPSLLRVGPFLRLFAFVLRLWQEIVYLLVVSAV
jgi:hypothetical protein